MTCVICNRIYQSNFSEANDLCNFAIDLPIDFHVHLNGCSYSFCYISHAHWLSPHLQNSFFKPSYISFTLFNVRFKRHSLRYNTFTCFL
ncbi:hypothetical protein CW304_30025 [Bacillus sp. UFRGS-B20]|nr:hypothetical protein CW304_30025 [Bacillus sp. UFRGS-B20]